ncbi:MAG: ABC transporter substrate-binding protein [Xanthobacteraceae bacterium]
MRRRKFITLLGGTAVAWPLAGRAQQPAMPVVGFVSGRWPGESAYLVAAFRRGLREAGFAEGGNVAIEYRWGEGDVARAPVLAAELVERGATVIATVGGGMTEVVKSVTTVPVVFIFGADPVRAGLVTGFNRPGGNATGIAILNYVLDPKRLEIIHEVAKGDVIAVLLNPNNPDRAGEDRAKEIETAARALQAKVEILWAGSEPEIDEAFRRMAGLRAGALLVSGDAYYVGRRDQLVVLAAHYRIPAIYHSRDIAVVGGLMSYGTSLPDGYRQVGAYVGRILAGEKPDDLPVAQATKLEFVINLKTSKALGLELPAKLLALADEVIE